MTGASREFEYGSTSRNTVMSWGEWRAHDATSLAGLVRRAEVTAQELAEQAAAAADLTNPGTQAVLELYEDTIADPYADGMNPHGLFHGVPIMNKDLGSQLKGRLQEMGSVSLKGTVGAHDDRLTRNYRDAGFNFIGRTAVPEAGMNYITQSNLHGETQNPWKIGFSPGGSSGGASAVVSSGVIPMTWSSDSGGSTRVPASYTGLIGIKHTRGLIQLPFGTNEYSWLPANEGLLTRTVRDYAGALDYLRRKDPGGTIYPLKEYEGSYAALLEKPLKRLKIAVSTGPWWRDRSLDPEVRQKIAETAARLEDLGHVVFEITDDELFGDMDSLRDVFVASFQHYCAKQRPYGITAADMQAQGMVPNLLASVVYAHQVYNIDSWKLAATGMDQFLLRFGEHFTRFDVLLCPVTATTVPRNDSPLSFFAEYEGAADWRSRGETWFGHLADNATYCLVGNVLGIPGLSAPAGTDSDGLPIGVQFYAAWSQDGLLLQLGRALEQAAPELFNQLAPFSVGQAA